ncbi:MAG: nitrous oxide reductase family maturation protein NosD [Kofleriaceae bacterium]|nr:nitrous oxide reductase family maturation protein NosD [Kofleriaceae bacterium]MCB9572362.1 nitrous oxide reductase family maturation protein NosD [Kofleriaceae bacterium]
MRAVVAIVPRLGLGLALAGVAACATDGHAEVDARPAPPAAPAGCRTVEADADLAVAVAGAADGDALCLAPGRFTGPVTLARRITLWGPRDAVVTAHGGASVVTVAAAGARVAGFSIDGTGGSYDAFDAAVHVIADDVVVEGVEVDHSVYGILVEKANRATVRGNVVRGDAATAMGLRGDTIRLWETRDSIVEDNLVEDGRDLVVWYSSGNRVARNRVLRGRYGTHLMYSHDNVIEDNRYLDGVVGIFVMYSHGVTLRRNLISDAAGAAGMAIGLKDSGNMVVEHNLLVRDRTGLYLDQTPNQRGDTLAIRGNVIRQCDVAIAFHTTPQGTTIVDNDLADDLEPVRTESGVEPTAATWRGNYYDDYVGYDLDDDGVGDLPHEARSASETLIAGHPDLAFFRGGPVMGAIDAGSKLLPLWQPRILLVDPAPRMRPHDPEEVLRAR